LSISEIGKPIAGNTILIPPSMLNLEPVHEAIYQLQIRTGGISNPEVAISKLTNELPKRFPDLKIIWVKVQDPNINMQISPNSPFVWAALLLFLPQILSAIGIIVSLIAVYLIVGSIPSWVWALLAIGAGILIFAPVISKAVTPTHAPKAEVVEVTPIYAQPPKLLEMK
jgi:hypothetical protein